MEILKKIFCKHEFKELYHIQGEYSPCCLVECKKCGLRDKINDYEGIDEDYDLDHPSLKKWKKKKINLQELLSDLNFNEKNTQKT